MSEVELEEESYSKCSTGQIKVFGGGSILYGFMTAACLFVVVILGSMQELNEHFLGKFNVVPKSSSHSIAIFLNNSVFLTTHFQFSYSMFIHYVFHVLMELHCHCVCFNIASGNHSWLASYYRIK